MKKFAANFYHTLTHPEEWSTISILLVAQAAGFLLSVLAVNAFDAQF